MSVTRIYALPYYARLNQGMINDLDPREKGPVQISEWINRKECGGSCAPKSISELFSVYTPSYHHRIVTNEKTGAREIQAEKVKELSFSAILGFIEGIPVIGSALAVINIIGHRFLLRKAYENMKHAVEVLEMPYHVNPLSSKQVTDYMNGLSDEQLTKYSEASDLFPNSAIDVAIHYNHLIGSFLSLIPFLKPAVRLGQAGVYYFQQCSAKKADSPKPRTA